MAGTSWGLFWLQRNCSKPSNRSNWVNYFFKFFYFSCQMQDPSFMAKKYSKLNSVLLSISSPKPDLNLIGNMAEVCENNPNSQQFCFNSCLYCLIYNEYNKYFMPIQISKMISGIQCCIMVCSQIYKDINNDISYLPTVVGILRKSVQLKTITYLNN